MEVIAGSDAGMAVPGFGSGLIGEIELLSEAGLSTRDVLRAATSRAAAALRSDDIGVLESGRAADLLLLDGNPLDDLDAIHEVAAVLRDGRMVVGDLQKDGRRRPREGMRAAGSGCHDRAEPAPRHSCCT